VALSPFYERASLSRTKVMMSLDTSEESFDLAIPSGVLRAHRFGPRDGELVLCAPGLSANAKSFDYLASELAGAGHQVVAVDLRGRGWSAITAAGTYGWHNHATDLLDAATALGSERFSLVGHSMGAFVGMVVARQAGHRLRSLALIDAAGVPEAAAVPPILAALERLGAEYPSADAYLARVRGLGTMPWNDVWERHYRYDLEAGPFGVRVRTSRTAIFEDVAYASRQYPPDLWSSLSMRSLLVRAALPLGAGYIVSTSDRDRFLASVPGSTSVDVDANHYGIMTHPTTAAALRSFLGHGVPAETWSART
jgi:pimeloyl-ACP methyl ester carboxylesterase